MIKYEESNWLKFEQLMNESDWSSPEVIYNDLNICNEDLIPDMSCKERLEDDLTHEKQ